MLRPVDRHTTYPGGFRYKVDVTGKEFGGPQFSLQGLVEDIRKHLSSNGMPVPANLEALVLDFTCRGGNGDRCEEYEEDTGRVRPHRNVKWEALKAGTTVMLSWKLSGDSPVPQEQADARSTVCATCLHNRNPEGCAPCQHGALHNLVESVLGSVRTVNHAKLEACDRCGCALRAKVWAPLKHILKVESIEPLPAWCWIIKENGNGGN